MIYHKYVSPPYCRAELYAGCITCWPLVSHSEYAERTDKQTDEWTPASNMTLSTEQSLRNKANYINKI